MAGMFFLGVIFYGAYKCYLTWLATLAKKQKEDERAKIEERQLRLLEARMSYERSSRKRHRSRKRRKALARPADWEDDEGWDSPEFDEPDSPSPEPAPVVRLSLPAPEPVAEPVSVGGIDTAGWNKCCVLPCA
jgi:hypothetical protein